MVKQVNRSKTQGGKQMTYEDRRRQERLLPSYLHHDHPGATALRTATLFLAVIGGGMPPQRSVKSRVSGPIWSHTNGDTQG